MDVSLIVFDYTHAVYLEFLARLNLGRPANHLFAFSKGRVKAEIGESKVFLRPCSVRREQPMGSFCYKLSAMSTLMFQFTTFDEIRFSISTPLAQKTFPRTAEYTLADTGSVSVESNSPAVVALLKHMRWSTMKILGFTKTSLYVEVGEGRAITLVTC
jgi:hypothetical protein